MLLFRCAAAAAFFYGRLIEAHIPQDWQPVWRPGSALPPPGNIKPLQSCCQGPQPGSQWALGIDRHELAGNQPDGFAEGPGHFPVPGEFPDAPKHEDKTIYEYLKETPEYSRIFRLVNFTEDITKLLDDPSSNVTFLAPSNQALRPPRRRNRRHAHNEEEDLEDNLRALLDNSDIEEKLRSLMNLPTAEVDNEQKTMAVIQDFLHVISDDDDKERKKEIFKKVVTAVLSYHVIPSALPLSELRRNNTWSTHLSLRDGSLDGEPLRLRVAPSLIPFVVSVNLFSKIVKPDTVTSNGIIHIIDRPVFPPASAFQILFLFSKSFATLTTALQRTGLTDAVDWHFVRNKDGNKGTIEGSPATTVFAPIDAAWEKLPPRLKLFLFSPFGERALKKLLSLHIVPDFVLYSDWAHNATDDVLGHEINEDDFTAYHPNVSYDYSGYVEGIQDHIQNGHPIVRNLRPFERAWSPQEQILHKQRSVPDHWQVNWKQHPAEQHARNRHNRGADQHCGANQALSEVVFTRDIHVSSLLTNKTLHVQVAQFKHVLPVPGHPFERYDTKVSVNGQQVLVPDLPVRNGALHILKKLIHPLGHRGHHGHPEARGQVDIPDDDWKDWEEWLPAWAEED